MHQCGRLERVIGSLAAHVRSRQPPKLVVDLGQNLIQRSIIPLPDSDQQLRQAFGICILHAVFYPRTPELEPREAVGKGMDAGLGVTPSYCARQIEVGGVLSRYGFCIEPANKHVGRFSARISMVELNLEDALLTGQKRAVIVAIDHRQDPVSAPLPHDG